MRHLINKMLKKDFARNKLITILLFLFMLVSGWLVASSATVIVEMLTSMDWLFQKAAVPDVVQMHTGELDVGEIEVFAANEAVKATQVVEMLTISGAQITIGNQETTEAKSIMGISFVTQNQGFDYLLNLDNQRLTVGQGKIAVPIYYRQQHGLAIGEKVKLRLDGEVISFEISDFVRDAQMNPNLASSKRFVLNAKDWQMIKLKQPDSEWLIEFKLKAAADLDRFTAEYEAANLPQKGPLVTKGIFKLLNALSDGIVAALIVLISVLLLTIALLCTRFMMLTTMEEDYREIGIMKAIGIPQKAITQLYLRKYLVLTGIACLVGYGLSFVSRSLFTENITLYMGRADTNWLYFAIPFAALVVFYLIVTFFCRLILRRFKKITVVQALRAGEIGNSRPLKWLGLKKSKLPVNLFLGIQDVFSRLKVYGLLCFVFVICLLLLMIPQTLLTTLQGPDFTSYMGIGSSDLRVDIQQTLNIEDRFGEVQEVLSQDQEVRQFASYVTAKYQVVTDEGELESINVESGDYSAFPLAYYQGQAPQKKNQIALSYLSSQSLAKGVGDSLELRVNEKQQRLIVSGIYQDITNGGKTAKALLEPQKNTILWYVLSIDMLPGVSLDKKMTEYSQIFSPAIVTDLGSFLQQTLGNTIDQLGLVVKIATIISLVLAVLITGLFVKMQLVGDRQQTTIKQTLGFSHQAIRFQYLVRIWTSFCLSSVMSSLFCVLIAPSLLNAVGAIWGIARFDFVVEPLRVYLFYPALVAVVVSLTTIVSTRSIIRKGWDK